MNEALSFVRKHGVVLVSARGPVPNVVEFLLGAPLKGSWWGHPQGREIFRALQTLHDSPQLLVCRLVNGKVTFVHRRLWPALARVAHLFPARQTARVQEEHTAAGHHVTHEIPFPDWVPREILEQAKSLDESTALSSLGPWAQSEPTKRRR